MPRNINLALNFLETQWSSINDNKAKGVIAEIRLKEYLGLENITRLYSQVIPGGWIVAPGCVWEGCHDPTLSRIAVIPNFTEFNWSGHIQRHSFTAQVTATTYFGQAGIPVYFVDFAGNINDYIDKFVLPSSGNYPTPYPLIFKTVGANELEEVTVSEMMRSFKPRNGNIGMRAYKTGRLNVNVEPWNNASTVTELFWKEYVRYFLQKRYLVSNNDIDFFIVGNSRRAYPVELKSKTCVTGDTVTGDWFGLDAGTFVKLAFFVTAGNNMDAIYVVEEVNAQNQHLFWWGIKFSSVINGCSWVTQGGGTGMTGGNSTTIKIPKSLFSSLDTLLPTL